MSTYQDINDGLTPVEADLARIRQLLEAKYKSDSDTGFQYVCSDGTSIPLTPLRMREWCFAIVCVLNSVYVNILLFSCI
jgi:hypothetical protein